MELLYWEGCPSYPRALSDLRATMVSLGLDPSTVIMRELTTDAEAQAERFIGSPTIRVNGSDVQSSEEQHFALTCRIYHRRDGRISPTPDSADLSEALREAMTSTMTTDERS